VLRVTTLRDPQALYRQWEESQWSPFAVDLTADREQWSRISDDERDLVMWALSSLMVAEERITTKFAGLVLAHGSEEEATYLATQQVDEARHMQFYARYQDEVIADPAAIARHVDRAREQLSPAFATVFDVALVNAHQRLVDDPADARLGGVGVRREDLPRRAVGVAHPDLVLPRVAAGRVHLVERGQPGRHEPVLGPQHVRRSLHLDAGVVERAQLGPLALREL